MDRTYLVWQYYGLDSIAKSALGAELPLSLYEAVGLYASSAISTLVAPVVLQVESFKRYRSDSLVEDFRLKSQSPRTDGYLTSDSSSPTIIHEKNNMH